MSIWATFCSAQLTAINNAIPSAICTTDNATQRTANFPAIAAQRAAVTTTEFPAVKTTYRSTLSSAIWAAHWTTDITAIMSVWATNNATFGTTH